MELEDPELIHRMILKDLMISGYRPKQYNNALVIMNFLDEAIDGPLAQPLANSLRDMGAKPAGMFGVPIGVADYPAVSIPHWCTNHSDWFKRFYTAYPDHFDINVNRRVICLNRRMSPVRTRAVNHLLQHFDRRELVVSHESIHTQVPTTRSLYVDGPADDISQHRPPPEQWLRAAIKLITEGNEQNWQNVPTTVLLSEKTYKCFAWRQFPIWISVPNTVQVARDLGFDVFDDLLQAHYYDTIEDEHERITQVLELVTYFASQPMHKLNELRYSMLARLQANYRRLWELHDLRERDVKRARNKFIKMFADNHPFRV